MAAIFECSMYGLLISLYSNFKSEKNREMGEGERQGNSPLSLSLASKQKRDLKGFNILEHFYLVKLEVSNCSMQCVSAYK